MYIVARLYKLAGNVGVYVRTHKGKHFRIGLAEHPSMVMCLETGEMLEYHNVIRNLQLESYIVMDSNNVEYIWNSQQVKNAIDTIANAHLDKRGGIVIKL